MLQGHAAVEPAEFLCGGLEASVRLCSHQPPQSGCIAITASLVMIGSQHTCRPRLPSSHDCGLGKTEPRLCQWKSVEFSAVDLRSVAPPSVGDEFNPG